jgi:transglutaminase-like putative cysteine protease
MALGSLSITRIPDGVAGIRVTMQRMANIARRAIRDERFIILVRQLTRGLPPADKMAEAKAIFDWGATNIRYVKDPVGIEMIMHPNRLVELGAGDCDDLSIFMGAAFESLGIQARFVAVESRLNAGYNHVYPQGFIDGQWITFDLASPRPTVGVSVPSVTEPLVQDISVSSDGLSKNVPPTSSWKPAAIVVISAVILIYFMR